MLTEKFINFFAIYKIEVPSKLYEEVNNFSMILTSLFHVL